MNVATTPDSRRTSIQIPTSRNSRYCCHERANLPPAIEAIMSELNRLCRKRPFLIGGQPVVRSMAASVSKLYDERGPSDDLARFLIDTGVLTPDPADGKKKQYYDPVRGAYIAACCSRCMAPDPLVETVEARIKRVIEEHARRLAESRTPILPPEPVESANSNDAVSREEVRVIPTHITKALDEVDDDVLLLLAEEIPKMMERRELERREAKRQELLAEQARLCAQREESAVRYREAAQAVKAAEREQLELDSREQEIAAKLEALGHTSA